MYSQFVQKYESKKVNSYNTIPMKKNLKKVRNHEGVHIDQNSD